MRPRHHPASWTNLIIHHIAVGGILALSVLSAVCGHQVQPSGRIPGFGEASCEPGSVWAFRSRQGWTATMNNDDNDDVDSGEALATPLLQRSKLPDSVRITPSFLGSRIYATSSTEFFVASGKQLVRMTAKLAEEDPGPDYQEPTVPLASLTGSALESVKHDGPITCLAGHFSSGSLGMLGVCDMFGGVSVVSPDGQEAWRVAHGRCPGFNDGESGFSGLGFNAAGSHLAVVRAFQKTLTFFDVATMQHTRTMHTVLPPNAMTVLGGGVDTSVAPAGYASGADDLVAVAEHNQVSIWDHRIAGRGATVARFSPSTAPIYSLAWGHGVLGCAGQDRSVFVYDPRKWSCCGRAMGVSKGDAMGLSFSVHDPRIFYLLGVDSQLVCGQWDDAGGSSQGSTPLVPVSVSTGGHKGTHVVSGGSLRKIFDFRAYGRWIAGCKMQSRDAFVGVCDQQSLYLLPEFNPLRPPRSVRPRTEADSCD